MFTYDQRTIDSAGAFLLGELEKLDTTLNLPLSTVTWNRDIELREDVTITDETASFTSSSFAASGGINSNGKNWISRAGTAIPGMDISIDKYAKPLHLWGMELSWDLIALEAAQRLGRPLDTQKYEGMQLKYNMDVDEQVYIGDKDLKVPGLCNNTDVFVSNSTLNWDTSTAKQILDDINDLLNDVWERSAYAVLPDQLRLPPAKMKRLIQPVSEAGTQSLLSYIAKESLTFAETGRELHIKSLKWLKGCGVSKSDRILAYTNDKKYVRFPLVPMQKTPLEYRGLHQLTTYYCKVGQMEFVYPETVGYMDGK